MNICFSLPLLLMLLISTGFAQTHPATGPMTSEPPVGMTGQVITLWPEGAIQPGEAGEQVSERPKPHGRRDRVIRGDITPTLIAFTPERQNAARTAVILCPGGGYAGQVIDREGYQIAEPLLQAGITAFVLKYRLPDGKLPADGSLPMPIQDVQRAIQYVRANADRWNLDPNRIGILGSSAGGHLAGAAATLFTPSNPNAFNPVERLSSRPDFATLLYPVASMSDELVHQGSRRNLIGDDADEATRQRFSIDRQITPQTPPLLLVHAKDDKVVKIGNSYAIRDAAAAAGVDCTLIEYDTGGHGFGIGVNGGEVTSWFDQYLDWLREHDLLDSR